MQFIITHRIDKGTWENAVSRFLETQAQPPEGVTLHGRWHAVRGRRGWALRESDDAADRRQNRVIIASFAVTAVVCGTLALDVQVWGFSWLTFIFYSAGAPLFLLALTMALRNRG